MLYFDKEEIVQRLGSSTWERVAFNEFEATLSSASRPFPCTFGVAGLKMNQLRYAFCERLNAADMAPALEHFVKHSRQYGPNTSLVFFSRPRPVASLESYERQFWDLLKGLADVDPQSWPEDVPTNIHAPLWEFCFAGEPIFVVCNTPAHVERQSRRSTSFMVTFQPRWVFDKIFKTEKSTQAAIGTVRKRLVAYDICPPSKHLGAYTDPHSLEFRQYFLREDDGPTSCPYTALNNGVSEEGEVA